jgi:hypothetical protein
MTTFTTRQQSLLRRSGLSAAGIAATLATASAAILSGGEAKAQICNFTGGSFTDCALNFAYPSTLPSDKEITFLSAPSAGAGAVRFEWNQLPPPGYAGDLWQVITDFEPTLIGPAAGTFTYKLRITDPAYTFKDVQLGVLAPINSTVRKEVYADSGFTTLVQDLTVNGTGSSGFVAFDQSYQHLWVRDTYTVAAGGVLDEFENGFRQVPGPLPLLGAGAAFGFSRKMRRRINGARQLSNV